MDPAVIPAAIVIVSACAQLSATVNLPAMTMYDTIGGISFHLPKAWSPVTKEQYHSSTSRLRYV